jgi:DNA-binding transcriptional regulator of glucitol operon
MALALLVAAVALHVFGIFRQIRHYRAVFSELSGRWRDADIGTGSAGGRIAASAMAIVVADEEGVVRALRLRQGAGSFAKFLPRDDLVGFSLPELRARAARAAPDVASAIGKAIDAIEQKREARPPNAEAPTMSAALPRLAAD